MPIAALQVARTGLDAQDVRMRVIANNLANVGTTGFKRDRANFATMAYQDARVAGQPSTASTAYATGLNLGVGVQVQSTTRVESQGVLQTTGNSLDLALDGDGFFQIELPGGKFGYTRSGNFSLSSDGQLVTSQGYKVLPQIQIPQGATQITISNTGIVSAAIAGQANPPQLGQLNVVEFTNPAGLKASSDNFMFETGASGPPQSGPAGENGRGQIRQGMLEGSNVSIVQELVDMIETQRGYEVNSKLISAVDEMLRNVNQSL